jgi:hypothetical protein
MKITQVRFPCGRIGLEVETTIYGGSEIFNYYSYFYNGSRYDRDFVKGELKEDTVLTYDYYGQMQGLVRVNKHNISLQDLARIASSEFMTGTCERPHTPLPTPESGATSPT